MSTGRTHASGSVASIRHRRRRRLLVWICAELAVAAVLLLLLLHRPAGYRPWPLADPNHYAGRPDRYLGDLLRRLYAQAGEDRSFEMVLLEDDINNALAGQMWTDPQGQVTMHSVTARLSQTGIRMMATAQLSGARIVVTADLVPALDQAGQLHLDVAKVMVGALNLTPVAMGIARRAFNQRVADAPEDLEHLGTKVAAALFNGSPFDPLIELGDRAVRLMGFSLDQGRVVLQFRPVRKNWGREVAPAAPPSLQLRGA